MTTLPEDKPADLVRGLGLWQSTALNIANMIGVGPFITIPLFLSTMGGPQALVGWLAAAVLVLCDGLVWSELGAALPGSGGTYHYLRETFGRRRFGRLLPFLFIWQFLISGSLELASGYIGASNYLDYACPSLSETLAGWRIPGGLASVAAAGAILIAISLCRPVRALGWLAIVLCGGTLFTALVMVVAGFSHFDASLLTLPPGAFRLDRRFASGLGGAVTIAVYDYLGYYNICHLGEEVRDPGRTIPRAIGLSVLLVAVIYLSMNLAIIGVVPWQEAMQSERIAADFMERLFGHGAAIGFSWLIVWTALAGTFAMNLGYSRIIYAAARNGDFFRPFAWLHPVHRYPAVAVLTIGLLTAVGCFFPLERVIEAAVTVRILIQFIGQIVALHVLRSTRPDVTLPFRMWCYPLPSAVALVGWLFVFSTRGTWMLLAGAAVIVSGCLAYAARGIFRRS
ncbi:MAG TPA: APC family permease [Pirellulales bacterium]|jgi:amino acid transporter|nr:APC family permease [Pirellulales bacterium]